MQRWYINIWSNEEGKTVDIQRIVESEVPLRKPELAEGSSACYLIFVIAYSTYMLGQIHTKGIE